MPGFHESFWSSDYAGGLGVLFGKLQQGVAENQQVLTIARLRAEAEDIYGSRLSDIGPSTDKVTGGFSRDDGASVRKAYDGVRAEMNEAARSHKKIATSIRELVVNPFTKWCDAHEMRVQGSQDELMSRIKHHDKQADQVRKLRSNYFNKCRLVEDIDEENKLAFQDPSSAEPSPKPVKTPLPMPIPQIKEPAKDEDSEDEPEPIEIGDETYTPDQIKKVLTHMLASLRLGETKVPILGTYLNTTCGADIVEYFQRNMSATSVSHAERIGQDLITHGFLRLVGNVGNTFANSSKMFYQWRPKTFAVTGIPEKKAALSRTFSIASESAASLADSPVGAVQEYLAGWNPLNNPHPNESPADKLRREASEADLKYKAAVRQLDLLRCQLEESMVDHLKFMERCELDRLKAIKAVILDFSGAIGNVIPSLQSTVDKMLLYQETVQPVGDLRYLLENYRTGGFTPKVQIYDNYYNAADEQTFGVDIEARARADRKRVPNIITTILTFLDTHYPDMEGDDARRGAWLVDVPLAVTHRLRSEINTGKAVVPEVLDRYEIPIVAATLKLYLLELPDSLVSSHVYEIIKTIYTTPASESSVETRISVLINTLAQLRLANIATLDALMTHFTRLIELTSASESYISALASALAPCILRPRLENAMTMEEKHAYRLIRDLFEHKEAIFSELKRAAAANMNRADTVAGEGRRPRAVSTDESARRANMEARQRAIAANSPASGGEKIIHHDARMRAISPAPLQLRHRRDRSSGGPGTRFPIQTSPTSTQDTARNRNSASIAGTLKRDSLEVPNSGSDASPTHDTHNAPPAPTETETTAPMQEILMDVSEPYMPMKSIPITDTPPTTTTSTVEEGILKRNSLGRSKVVGRNGIIKGRNGDRDSIASLASLSRRGDEAGVGGVGGGAPHGVQLEDKPMDDD